MENAEWKPQLCRRLLKAAAYRNPPPGEQRRLASCLRRALEHMEAVLSQRSWFQIGPVLAPRLKVISSVFSLCPTPASSGHGPSPLPPSTSVAETVERRLWRKATRLSRCAVWGTSSWVRQAGNDKEPFQTARMFSFNCLSQLFYSGRSFLARVCNAARSLYISHLL